jgi:hypothetical protein
MATKSWTKDEIVSVRVKDEVKARLEKEAQDEGVSLAELVRRKLESTKLTKVKRKRVVNQIGRITKIQPNK